MAAVASPPRSRCRRAFVTTCSRNTVVEHLAPRIADFAKRLPSGYSVAVGGSVEESAKSQGPIKAVIPLMLFVMATILMIQLQSFSRLFLVCAVAPLALVGVVLALLPSGAPLGFVAILGVLALIGILIRNSVILIVQIEHLKEEGRPSLGCCHRGNGASYASNYADRSCRKLGAYADRAGDFLGPDGLRHDGRHHCRYAADAVIFTGSVCGVVPDQAAGPSSVFKSRGIIFRVQFLRGGASNRANAVTS